jgi:nicotinamide phosphoribosyltransferase
MADGYKVDHRSQYPKGTQLVYSNLTPRSTAHAPKITGCDNKIVLFGLQYFIKWFLIQCWGVAFFDRPKDEVVANYRRRITNYLGPDAISYEHIEALHDLGYLPVAISALPEGSSVDERVPVLTIENTLPEFFWLTNFLETVMSNMIWKPCTSATTARKYRQLLDMWCEKTGGPLGAVQFQAHDFSFRGLAGLQDAQMSGAAHLLSFVGTDSIPAIDFLETYYGANSDEELIGCSVPATEHSVMCMGSQDGEFET